MISLEPVQRIRVPELPLFTTSALELSLSSESTTTRARFTCPEMVKSTACAAIGAARAPAIATVSAFQGTGRSGFCLGRRYGFEIACAFLCRLRFRISPAVVTVSIPKAGRTENRAAKGPKTYAIQLIREFRAVSIPSERGAELSTDSYGAAPPAAAGRPAGRPYSSSRCQAGANGSGEEAGGAGRLQLARCRVGATGWSPLRCRARFLAGVG